MQFKLPVLIALSLGLTTPLLAAGDGASGAKWGYKTQDDVKLPLTTKNPAHQSDSASTSTAEAVLSPANWGQSYPTCNSKRQSPIDIVAPASRCKVKEPAPLSFSGDCSSYGLKAFEDTFKWTATNTTCKVHRGDRTYALLQFHLHMPSEHTLSGKSLDAEAHFVHQEVGGDELLVIGMFLSQTHDSNTQSQDQHPWLDTVWNSVASVNATVQVAHSYADLLSEKMHEGSVFNYAGSLTTPPCTESVDWWVLKTPLFASKTSLETFKSQLATLEATDGGNGARPVQPLHGRQITVY